MLCIFDKIIMSEIWNLSALCRCCHTDGQFKSLEIPYMNDGTVEIYAKMLLDTFGINMKPPLQDSSYNICDECIQHLREAARFKQIVLECEKKFDEYCKNEQAFNLSYDVKLEIDPMDNDDDMDNKCSLVNEMPLDVKSDEFDVEISKTIKYIKTEDEMKCFEGNENMKSEILEKKLATKDNGNARDTTKKQSKPNVVHKVAQKMPPNKDTLKLENRKTNSKRAKKKRNYTCEICQKEFKLQGVFIDHMKTHGVDRPFKCGHCDKSFTRLAFLSNHENSHTKKQIFICNICNKSFPYKTSLTKHISWHMGTNKKCVCDKCGRSFNDRTNLNVHVRTVHDKIKPYSCTFCPKTFAAKKNMFLHLRRHTGERPYKCDTCNAAFIERHALKVHKETHDTITNYTCVVCKAQFTKRGSLRNHMKTHKGFLPHQCPICYKEFTCKYSRNRHVEEHSGIKKYKCEICEKAYTQKTQLNRHMAGPAHNPDTKTRQKVKCDICNKLVNDIEKHKTQHVNRPYMCQLCSKSYPQTNSLNRHLKAHYGIKPHACDVCGKRYTKVEHARRHKLKAHKVLKTEAEDNFEASVPIHTIESSN